MAITEPEKEGNGSAQAGNGNDKEAQQASLSILTQYVKDLSFESPGAPQSLRGRDKAPGISINVNVNANPISGTEFDVLLSLNAQASFEKDKGVTYPSVLDRDTGSVLLAFSKTVPPKATPTTLVIDKKGRVSARILGAIPDRSILDSLISDAVAEN